ncbi:uncharacterized protein EDB91DRAFT_214478 [Suillus paluster]|uniref:uncharacterized protein n=1 Tax=Suillus paluster TaxID=48578 RepID=UPI001B8784CB|nr:uncharacterized protein EDB91DRAFT_214478 [Suillus paluster]KAG1722334.1 hypothetical protein EDB91DRAFT_214478 [Suillus paluster]
MAGTGRRVRTDFTTDEDILLVKFIATYNPTKQNRSGNTLYKRLVENVDGKWNWSKTHPWPSWRDRYVKNADEFDRKIARYQKKKGINSEKQPSREPVFSPSDEEEEDREGPLERDLAKGKSALAYKSVLSSGKQSERNWTETSQIVRRPKRQAKFL